MATKQQQQDFLKIIAPFAIAEMENSGILASVIIAQAILESGWGLSTATRLGCNLFGIKADCNWKGQFVTATGWEEDKKGNKTYSPMRWRKYNSWAESIKDHSLFLKAKRYSNIIGDKDYKSVANKLKLDGYATSVNYSQQLISIIEQYQLINMTLQRVIRLHLNQVQKANVKLFRIGYTKKQIIMERLKIVVHIGL